MAHNFDILRLIDLIGTKQSDETTLNSTQLKELVGWPKKKPY